ncbi:MAG TPA: ferredoxin [Acidimicrobiales bacterium]|nr:ferredoxin [Acidimicrobiales bacterium]
MTAHPPRSRLLVDGARCDGHGICALSCPERISLDEWGYATVDPAPIEDRATFARARRAVAACPAGALRLADAPVAVVRAPDRAMTAARGPGVREN